MKRKNESNNDEILIGTHRVTVVIPGMLGIASLVAGIMLVDVASPAANALIGVGLIALSAGIYLFLHSKHYRVHIDDGKKFITIIENGFRRTNRVEIPSSSYTGILVQPRISDNPGNRTASRYEVFLTSDLGSTLLISEYKNEEEALAYAKELESKFGFTLHYEDELSRMFKGKRQHLGGTSKMVLPERSGISVSRRGDVVSLKWKTRRDVITYSCMVMGIYGVIHIILFAAVPMLKENSLIYLLYAGILLAAFIVFAIFGIAVLGTFTLECAPNQLIYYVKVLGGKIGERSIARASIALVKNSIGKGNETITIMTERGCVAIRRMVDQVKKGGLNIADLSIFGEVTILKNECIEIPATSLSLQEKFFIEDVILRSMPESR